MNATIKFVTWERHKGMSGQYTSLKVEVLDLLRLLHLLGVKSVKNCKYGHMIVDDR